MSPHDLARLKHMRDAAESALHFARNRSRADLDTDEMLLFALVRALEIIGEAAGKISNDTRAEFAEIPWSAMVGMRNRLMHAYFDVDRDILWATVSVSLPELLQHLGTVPR
jgi:uncharacterized protein with HEPN domain